MAILFESTYDRHQSPWRAAAWLTSGFNGPPVTTKTETARLQRRVVWKDGVEGTAKHAAENLGGRLKGHWFGVRANMTDVYTVLRAKGPDHVVKNTAALRAAAEPADLPVRRLLTIYRDGHSRSFGVYLDQNQILLYDPCRGLRREEESKAIDLLCWAAEQNEADRLRISVDLCESTVGVARALAERAETTIDLARREDIHLLDADLIENAGINPVTAVVCNRFIGASREVRAYFKADGVQVANCLDEVGLTGAENFSTRAVASGALSKALGLDLLSEDIFANLQGRSGVLSAARPGKPCRSKVYESIPHILVLLEATRETDYGDYELNLSHYIRDSKYRVTFQANGNPEGVYMMKGDPALMSNWDKHPDGRKQLYDLQALDFLTGQVDRHGADILWDEASKSISGIDNDMCFPPDDDSVLLRGEESDWPEYFRGPPPLLDFETFEAIDGLKPKSLKSILESVKAPDCKPLTKREIQAALDRLERMKRCLSIGNTQPFVPSDTTRAQGARTDYVAAVSG